MDAQSLHKHIQGSTKTRISAKPGVDEPIENNTPNDEDVTGADFHREELDYNGGSITAPTEEPHDANIPKDDTNSASEPPVQAPHDFEHDIEDMRPQAAILSAKEDRHRSFNAFSSHHASAPVPRRNRRAIVKEAKPVKDNANAIIMTLLIAILIIAVAIFGVIVAAEHRREQRASQASSTTEKETPSENPDSNKKKYKYDFSGIIGSWQTIGNGDSCLKIDEESMISWVQNCGVKTGDSFSGSASIIGGQDAIDSLNITRERAARTAGIAEAELNLDQTFAIVVAPDEYKIGGVANAQKPSEIKLLLVETKDDEIVVYNYLYAERTIYSKDKEGSGLN